MYIKEGDLVEVSKSMEEAGYSNENVQGSDLYRVQEVGYDIYEDKVSFMVKGDNGEDEWFLINGKGYSKQYVLSGEVWEYGCGEPQCCDEWGFTVKINGVEVTERADYGLADVALILEAIGIDSENIKYEDELGTIG